MASWFGAIGLSTRQEESGNDHRIDIYRIHLSIFNLRLGEPGEVLAGIDRDAWL